MAALPDLPQVERAVVELTNAARAAAKLAPVTVSPQLTAAARAYAALLGQTGRFLHDADGSPAGRAQRAGWRGCDTAENLALRRDANGFETGALAASAVQGWLASPMHKRNLLSARYGEIGIGVARMPDQVPKYVVVQVLGRAGLVTVKVNNGAAGPVSVTFAGSAKVLAPGAVLTLRSCSADTLVIENPGPKSVVGRYAATDGATYVVSGAAGDVHVTVQPKR